MDYSNHSSVSRIINTVHNKSIDSDTRDKYLLNAFKCLDLTSLEGNESEDQLKTLCELARVQNLQDHRDHVVASVCIFTDYVSRINILADQSLQICAVVGGFPKAGNAADQTITDIQVAAESGADEFDFVMPQQLLKNGRYEELTHYITAVRQAAGDHIIKAILETGELGQPDLIRRASRLALQSGIDFIKTSTGKTAQGATPEAVVVMALEIKQFYEETGIKKGLKVSGGIRTVEQAIFYQMLVTEILGDQWLTPSLFRIGASSLVDALLLELDPPV